MLPINQKLTRINFTDANNTSRIKYIVFHYFGSLGSAENVANYFYNTLRKASAHYCVDDTSIWQCVLDEDIAWHCGDSGIGIEKGLCTNSNSIGIEVRPYKMNSSSMLAKDKDWYFHEKTIINTIELIQLLMKKYNIPIENIVRHYDVTSKLCPRPFVGNDINIYYSTTGNEMWQKFKSRLIGESEIMEQETFNKMMDNYLETLAKQDPSSWSLDARKWAEKNNIISQNIKDQHYKSFCTREEAMEFLRRFKNIL